ncbi:MAG: IS66 family insertion sequence element accessory protein TnpB [Bdellovibrio sp.]|nr:IS66 family insertion sequence element accessory protein TnpB [Bdellovibrio sp.]
MRASYDSLFGKVRQVLHQDPQSGHLFVFINSRRTSCKCLYFGGFFKLALVFELH